MSDTENLVLDKTQFLRKKGGRSLRNARGPCFLASGFILFWLLLFLAVVVPLFHRVPDPKSVEDASKGVFIAQRAMDNLYNLVKIGPKVVGSENNEIKAVQFLLNELALIEKNVLDEYFDIEVDLQEVSGSYIHWTMVNKYQGVQNIVIKLSPKNCTSETYLLVNSHFDSKPTSPSAGDAGQMVAIILEVLRVMSTTRQTFTHPIIFLLNGAEENPLQASHGFITQHKWAPFCKAFLNLEGCAGGGRELLFQTGPNHPWLVDYYKKSAKHPFATTVGEEIFQTGSMPSDTDFGILTKYGGLIGLDMAQNINGYTYHTKYDTYDIIPSNSVQSMGENVLSVVRALSNATELENTAAYEQGPSVFFDVLGLYFVNYTNKTGIVLNFFVAISALLLIYLSLGRMANHSKVSTSFMVCWFFLILVVQVVAVSLAIGLPILIANFFDKHGLSLTYFSTKELMFGLYVCPSLFGLLLPPYIFLDLPRHSKTYFRQQLHMVVNAHAFILALLVIGLTVYGLRSTYVLTWTLLFYIIPLAINLITTLHDQGISWTGAVVIFQLFSFLYNSYLLYTLIQTMIAMMGRFGRSTNPDLVMSAINALGTVLAMGFLAPIVIIFRRPGLILLTLMTVFGVSIFLATVTPLGFPYRAATNVERVPYLHVRRTFYEYNGNVSKEDSGYLFNFQDRRGPAPLEGTNVNLTGLVGIATECEERMMCGQPLYDHRWVKNRLNAMWLPREELIDPPYVPKLQLLSKIIQSDKTTVRFKFTINTTDHTSLFIQPYEFVNITNWSFPLEYIGQQTTYHVYFSYGKDNSPLSFFIDLSKSNGDFRVPLFQLGVCSHFIGNKGDELSQKFAQSFPDYAVLIEWPTSYQRFIF
ncbi:endoplasmic reticulum metallopeptidase 1-like isoform X1 [Drosophila rhopaloa]|uniref:Endoplasmic reticulum metallopeptidase 1-like n=1 Tax=Drosophila rhopaloa TaxID=1041015 RepID=A0ABM5HCL0_DRORH|nr:endoplasmic reticulum metallopeptidase 1-like isoform X1 [Drosophila rhopaloa]